MLLYDNAIKRLLLETLEDTRAKTLIELIDMVEAKRKDIPRKNGDIDPIAFAEKYPARFADDFLEQTVINNNFEILVKELRND